MDQYREWLAFHAEQGKAKLLLEIHEEITRGKDELSEWAKSCKGDLILQEEVDVALIRQVTTEGCAPDRAEVEIEAIGRDPFPIAYALAGRDNRTVVTEKSGQTNSAKTAPSQASATIFPSRVAISEISVARWTFGRIGITRRQPIQCLASGTNWQKSKRGGA